MPETKPYEVDRESRSVVDSGGRTVLACGDLTSAEQYAVMLNEAWAAGYRAGRRARKESEPGPAI